MTFLEEYSGLLDKIRKDYKIPKNKNFQQRKFEKMNWNRGRERNFFTMIKILAENGPCSISKIIELDPFSKVDKKIEYRRQVFYRLTKHTTKKKIIKRGNSNEKGEITYHLDLFGIFLAIEFFVDPFGLYCVLIDINMKKIEGVKSLEFVDILAKNYHDSLPLIFGKWDELKNNYRSNRKQFFRMQGIKLRD